MKLNKWTLYAGCILPLIAACSADAPIEVDTDYGLVEINLNGGIGTVTSSATTRGSLQGMINGKDVWANDLTVSFARADAASGTYTAYQPAALTADVKKEVTGNVHQISFSSATYYQANGQNTKLIGWYPVVGSNDSFDAANHKVTFGAATMDGETDYIVTDLVEGNKVPATQIQSVTFNHLLMQLSVKVYAEDTNVQGIWGGIKSVAIDGLKQQCEVTLPDATATASGATAKVQVTFANTSPTATDLPLVKKNFSDNTAISYSGGSPLVLGIAAANATLAGYAMFAPQGSTDITLTVETETGGIQKPVVKAPAGGFLAGYSYEVVLKFGASSIAPTVTIKDWASGTNPGEVVI